MSKYRKKPVVVEANLYYDNAKVVLEWIGMNGGLASIEKDGSIHITTLEGLMKAQPGDWIIKGVKGEFYPCKPDIFDATYEEVVEGV